MDGGEYKGAAEGGANSDLGRFFVAYLADHEGVGILTQEGADAFAKGQATLVLHLNLGDAGEFKFNGVFDGHDVLIEAV